MENMRDVIVGIGGAAGDGLDKTGDTIAKTCSRLGLYVYAYNSYQSVIRGGHIWLRVRLAEQKVCSHGDHLNVLIALNQDAIERHAREVEPLCTLRRSHRRRHSLLRSLHHSHLCRRHRSSRDSLNASPRPDPRDCRDLFTPFSLRMVSPKRLCRISCVI
jgi:pyruvate ferredoxin/flavodoxin oxidoreductase-like protein